MATPGGYGGKPPGVACDVSTGARNIARASTGDRSARTQCTPLTLGVRQESITTLSRESPTERNSPDSDPGSFDTGRTSWILLSWAVRCAFLGQGKPVRGSSSDQGLPRKVTSTARRWAGPCGGGGLRGSSSRGVASARPDTYHARGHGCPLTPIASRRSSVLPRKGSIRRSATVSLAHRAPCAASTGSR